MRGGALPPALLCAALGFALGYAPPRSRLYGIGAAVVAAFAASWIRLPAPWMESVFAGCWISVVVAACAIHLPRGVGPRLALALALNAGLWAGLVVAGAGVRTDLLKALPWLLLAFPAAWAKARGWGIGVKVAASWLVAIALLCAFLPVTTKTPGYAPDHMD